MYIKIQALYTRQLRCINGFLSKTIFRMVHVLERKNKLHVGTCVFCLTLKANIHHFGSEFK